MLYPYNTANPNNKKPKICQYVIFLPKSKKLCHNHLMSNYKRLFLDGHSYFITIVTHRREPILIDHIDLLRKSFALSKKRYGYKIEAVIVLPDHIHMIITPQKADKYPKIISHIKRSFVYRLTVGRGTLTPTSESITKRKQQLSSSQYKRQHSGIWQQRFYEHTIRDEKDWSEKMVYIQHNAVKHGLVDDWTLWEYSLFFES